MCVKFSADGLHAMPFSTWQFHDTRCSEENTGCLQKNGAVSKINKKFISHLTRAKRTPTAAATVQVSHALPTVRFSCLMRGRGASFQDGVAPCMVRLF